MYDKGGNILSKTENGVTKTYSYGDSTWKDLLTAYNGNAITYDTIGNPLTYYDGKTFDWDGRQLKSVGTGTTYKYNADGIRTQKIQGSNVTQYYLNGSQILASKDNFGWIYYDYDATGKVVSVNYYGTTYYYVHNLQGDVIALTDANGAIAVEYEYDPWGKVISFSGPYMSGIGLANPFRYRGYFYDSETGFYYVSSRYYDPEIGRWINADSVIAGVGGNVKGYNLFAYCFNNPVNMDDQAGNWPDWIKNTVKWVAKNIVKPVVKTVQKTLSKVDVTYSRGINVSGTPSVCIFDLQAGISIDTKGNVAIQGSVGGGVTGGSPGASITAYQSVTNAPSIDKLEGSGYQIGGSVGVPVYGVPLAAGGDFNIIPDSALNTTYLGATTNVGFGTHGGEFHVEKGETATWNATRFNIFDVAENIYIKIMEW